VSKHSIKKQKNRIMRAKRLSRERMKYLKAGMPKNKGFDVASQPIQWMQGVKDAFPTHATGKLRCSHSSGEHQWDLSKGKTFYRCKSCNISTYNHHQSQ